MLGELLIRTNIKMQRLNAVPSQHSNSNLLIQFATSVLEFSRQQNRQGGELGGGILNTATPQEV